MFVVDSTSRPEGETFLKPGPRDPETPEEARSAHLDACLRLRRNHVSSSPAGSAVGSAVVWAFSGIKWQTEPPEGDRRQREQELKVTSTCGCWRPGHRGRRAGLGAGTVTGSNTEANKLFQGRRPPCRLSEQRSLSQPSLTILNPCHVATGLICPVNSMQMLHDSAVTEQYAAGTYCTSGDGRRGEAGSTGDASFLLSSSDPRGAQPRSRWPLPRDRAGVLRPSAAPETRLLPPQALPLSRL